MVFGSLGAAAGGSAAACGVDEAGLEPWMSRGCAERQLWAAEHAEALSERALTDLLDHILARIPAGRWGTPDDLGGAAVFLASRASDYVHGAIMPVDGGWLAR